MALHKPRPCFECGKPIGDEEPAYARIGGALRVLHEGCLESLDADGGLDEVEAEERWVADTREEARCER